MLKANLVSTDYGQEGGNSWAGRPFPSAKFVSGLNKRLTVCKDTGRVFRLHDEGAKMLDDCCDSQSFDFAR